VKLQIGNALASFAEALEQFHSSGLEHLAAANRITKCLQEFSSLCSNQTESTLTKHFTKASFQLDCFPLKKLLVLCALFELLCQSYKRYKQGY